MIPFDVVTKKKININVDMLSLDEYFKPITHQTFIYKIRSLSDRSTKYFKTEIQFSHPVGQ